MLSQSDQRRPMPLRQPMTEELGAYYRLGRFAAPADGLCRAIPVEGALTGREAREVSGL